MKKCVFILMIVMLVAAIGSLSCITINVPPTTSATSQQQPPYNETPPPPKETPPPTPPAPIYTTQTQLLVVVNKELQSIGDIALKRGIVIACPNQYSAWLTIALRVYGIARIRFAPLSPSDYDDALLKGVVDAVLVCRHPTMSISDYIASGGVRILPWIPEAIDAVIIAFPGQTVSSKLPANTYKGQTSAISGYAPSTAK